MRRAFVVPALLILAAGLFAAPAQAAGGPVENFRAHLTGAGEVPPVDTAAHGHATFQVRNGGTELRYKLNVVKLDNFIQAHIHCGGPDVNGPVVVFLFGPVPGGVDANGRVSQATATDADVIPRPDSPACPGGVSNLADVIEKMRNGEAYANAHTVQNPGGEIRGHISG